MKKDLELKVAEAIQDDVNKGIIRIDSTFMKEISIKPGEIIEIEGQRKTVGIVDRAYPGDIGLNIIRMDGLTRRNCKAGIGERVKIRKVDVKEAKKIIIAPAREGIIVRASPEIFKQGLLGRAAVKGDIVSLGGTRRRRSTMTGSPFFDDVFSMLDENLMGFGFGDLKFIVADINPKQAVIITDSTEVVFNPQAMEVKEERIPDITYEDIGGLNEEVKKIREMIELPLKHPEIFEALGIEAPKGVLLHGPPGTGKTLLAKAVANETNAHFILINGPEIMSKFYGQSLPYEEKVLIKENGAFKRVPIGELVEQNRGNIEAVCFDKEGKVSIKKVTSLIKHPCRSRLLQIKTRSGRSITVTDDHSVFTLGKDGITDIKTSDLIAGKSFIAIPKQIPFNSDSLDTIDLIELLKEEDYGIKVRNVQKDIRKAIEILSHAKTATLLGVKEKYLYDIIYKNVGISVKKYCQLMKEANLTVDKSFLQLTTKGKSFPCILKITESLCAFLGLWMAEGSYTNKNEVRLSIHRKEEAFVAQLCRELFGTILIYQKPQSRGSDIYICSGILGKIMKHVLGFNSGARKKKIPSFIYNLSKENLSAFLRGYISGDGSLNTTTPAPMVEIATESPALADDIIYLLLQFGIIAKIYGRKNRPQKRICFADYENLERFKEIGFFDAQRNKYIYDYLLQKKFSRRDQLPIAGAIRNLVENNYNLSAWKNSPSIGKQVLQEVLDPKLQNLLANDIYWDKAIEIIPVENKPEYVYDLSVPGAENFIAGFGGIYTHNSEENLRKKFEDAEKNAPAIIFIDEIDAIASKREETRGEVERRVVAQLLAMMDGLKSRGKVVVIAASNVPNILDPALRRPGRFDREIEIGVPKAEGRLNILKIHTRSMPLMKNVDLDELAKITHGFVGADIAALAKEAAMVVLRRVMEETRLYDTEEALPKELLEKLRISKADFKEALKFVRPSALREVLVEVPNVKWDDIGGMQDVKQELKEAVEWPLKYPDAFKRLGVHPPKGILLYGPPGTGKTLLAKAVANESEANFISVKGPELMSKWFGESEKGIREVFKKARQSAPTVVFFDEIDSIAPRRGISGDSHVTERMVNQMLTEMDGLIDMHDVLIIAATNRPDILDTAILRPGRFDRIILAPVPDLEARESIFKVHTKNMPLSSEINAKELAEKTEGYVGADIEAVCREAAMLALRENIETATISKEHFEKALQKVRPSVSKDVEETYKMIKDQFSAVYAKEMKRESPNYFG